MRIAYHVMSAPAPLGLLFLASTDKGVRHVEFMDRRSLKRTIQSHASGAPEETWEPSVLGLRPYADQLDQYFTGTSKDLDWPLDFQGDPLSVSHVRLTIDEGGLQIVEQHAKAEDQAAWEVRVCSLWAVSVAAALLV